MAVLQQGGVPLGHIAGVPVRFHWSALLGAFIFTGFRFDAALWISYLGLIVVHELGHALVVKAARAKPTLIELTGYGGLCHWKGEVSAVGRAAIAWGGVWAQLVLLAAAEGYAYVYGLPRGDDVVWRIFYTLTVSNAWIIAVNLIPIRPLDGAEAWRLPILLGRKLRAPAPADVLPAAQGHGEHDEAFEAGARRDEVKAIVSNILDDARKE